MLLGLRSALLGVALGLAIAAAVAIVIATSGGGEDQTPREQRAEQLKQDAYEFIDETAKAVR